MRLRVTWDLPAALLTLLFIIALPSQTAHADQCTWIGSAGNWSDPAGWSCGFVPDGNDVAAINSGTVNLDVAVTVSGLELAGGTLTGANSITVSGLMTWTGGTQGGTGTTTVSAGATLQLSGGSKTLDGRTLNSQGSASLTGGNLRLSNGAIVNNGGTWDMQSDAHLDHFAGATSTWNNIGTLRKSGGVGTSLIEVNMNNHGTILVATGVLSLQRAGSVSNSTGYFGIDAGATLQFSQGTHTLETGSLLGGGGTVEFGGANVAVLGTYSVGGTTLVRGGTVTVLPAATVANIGATFTIMGGTIDFSSGDPIATNALDQTGGTITGSDQLTITGQFTWGTGFHTGTGTTIIGTGASFELHSFPKNLDRRTFINRGVGVWTGGNIRVSDASTIINEGVWDIRTSAFFQTWGGGISTLNNTGVLLKNVVAEATAVEMHFNNTGSVQISAGTLKLGIAGSTGAHSGDFAISMGGTLAFDQGAHTLQAASSITGMGAVSFGGASVTILGDYDLAGATAISGGLVTFSPESTITGIGSALTISGGTLELNSGAPVEVTTMTQSNGTIAGADAIAVAGSFNWSGGTQSGAGTTTILPGASLPLGPGNALRVLSGWSLVNDGNAVWTSGDLWIANASIITNSGVWEVLTDADFRHNGGETCTFNNQGTLHKTSSAGTTLVELHFNNQGSVGIDSGTLELAKWNSIGTSIGDFAVSSGATLEFSNGTQTLEAGSTVVGPGTVAFTGAVVHAHGAYSVSGATVVTAGTVTFAPDSTVASVGDLLQVSSGVLELNNGEPIQTTTFDQSGGTVAGVDDITVTGQFQWTGGTLSGTGSTTIGPTGSLIISGTSLFLDGWTLANQGTALWKAGDLRISNAATVSNSGLLTLQADLSLDYSGGETPTFENSGTFRKTAGNGASLLETHLLNAGTIEILSGVIKLPLAGSTGTTTGGFSVAAGSTLEFGNVTHAIEAGASISGGGAVMFTGGAVAIRGDYNVGGATLVSGGTVTFEPAATILQVGGALAVSGGTLDLSSGDIIQVATLVQTNGTVTGSDELRIANEGSWTGGTQSGTGITVIKATASLSFSGSLVTLNGRSLANYGSVDWGAGTIRVSNAATIANDGTWVIHDGLTLDYAGGETSTFNNSGTLIVSPGAGTVSLEAHFYNSGLVSVATGTLALTKGGTVGISSGTYSIASGAMMRFASGTHTLAAGSAVIGPGIVQFSGAAVTIRGSYTLSGATSVSAGSAVFETASTVGSLGVSLLVSGGTLTLGSGEPMQVAVFELSSGTVTGGDQIAVTGSFSWTSGWLSGTGATTVAAGATLTMNGSGRTLSGWTLNNAGTANWIAGPIYVRNAATISNTGTWQVYTDADLDHQIGDVSTFNNSGAFYRAGSGGTTLIEMNFNNAGSVQIVAGALELGKFGTVDSSSGTFSVSEGASLKFSNGTRNLQASSSLSGAGSVAISGGTVNVLGTYDVAGPTSVTGGLANFDGAAGPAFGDLSQTSGQLRLGCIATVAGDLMRSGGAFLGGTGTVVFAGTMEQTIGGSVATAFYNLSVAGGATVAVPVGASSPTVAGTLSNNGTLKQTRDVDNTGGGGDATFSFLRIANPAGSAKYFGVEITVGPGADMGLTDVYVSGAQPCVAGDQVQRCFELLPQNGGISSTVRFYYREAESNGNLAPFAWRWNGSAWDLVDPYPTRDTSNPESFWVEADGVSAYSRFALFDDPSPVYIPPEAVSIDGPDVGIVGQTASFVATVSPPETSVPLTYEWLATGQQPVIHTGGLVDSVAFAWTTPGVKSVSVTASNPGGNAGDSHSILVVSGLAHVNSIRLRYQPRNGQFLVSGSIRILNQNNQVVPGATVTTRWTLPDGSQQELQALTKSTGVATIQLRSALTGTYQVCVTDVVKVNWLYDPGDNDVTCATLQVP